MWGRSIYITAHDLELRMIWKELHFSIIKDRRETHLLVFFSSLSQNSESSVITIISTHAQHPSTKAHLKKSAKKPMEKLLRHVCHCPLHPYPTQPAYRIEPTHSNRIPLLFPTYLLKHVYTAAYPPLLPPPCTVPATFLAKSFAIYGMSRIVSPWGRRSQPRAP